ncbi:hypothetical protein MAM1_0050c03335 [Mucor ambiguus]|uniref:Uncharacterized protein n=1 Tax=Mucor ambiguus TaxID=91626 RepID=A0A0C9M9G4_9FUNG|nr:hypothetical protein MAM1_0050c03335 [Mucor ambiguus]
MRTIAIGRTDDTLMRKALYRCGWVSKTEESKRKVMVYDIEDNFPISECLKNESIKMIPAENHFAVVTMTRYYVKTCVFQALEDILPTDKYYHSRKVSAHTCAFDYYEMICEKTWQHVLESIYETDCLLEYPLNVDVMDIEFTLESYNSFKVAFTEYMLNEFPFAYASKPDEKHRFLLHLKQDVCNIILTNRLVLHAGVLPTKLLEIRFQKKVRISDRQFGLVHSYPCLKLISGSSAFGYEALKTGVIRGVETNNFALGFQYFDNDKASFVEVIHNQPGPARFIQGTDACIITKIGAPFDNNTRHHHIPALGFKIPDIENVSKASKYLLISCSIIQTTVELTKSPSFIQNKRHCPKKRWGYCFDKKL